MDSINVYISNQITRNKEASETWSTPNFLRITFGTGIDGKPLEQFIVGVKALSKAACRKDCLLLKV